MLINLDNVICVNNLVVMGIGFAIFGAGLIVGKIWSSTLHKEQVRVDSELECTSNTSSLEQPVVTVSSDLTFPVSPVPNKGDVLIEHIPESDVTVIDSEFIAEHAREVLDAFGVPGTMTNTLINLLVELWLHREQFNSAVLEHHYIKLKNIATSVLRTLNDDDGY